MSPPSEVELARLLAELFDVEELQRFLRDEYRDIANTLPANIGLVPLASLAAEALARRDMIDDELSGRLVRRRPRCARRLGLAAPVENRVPPTTTRKDRWAGPTAVLGGVIGVTALIWLVDFGRSRHCEVGGDCPEGGPSKAASADPPAGEPEASMIPPQVLRCPDGMVLIDDIADAGPQCLDRTEVTRRSFCASDVGSARVDAENVRVAYRCAAEKQVDWWSHPITHVRPDEAAAYCAGRGLRLPERQWYVRVLRAELGARPVREIVQAVNVCGVECHQNERPEVVQFTHRDPHVSTAPVGSHRGFFASPHGLDDIFGNVSEMVRDGARVFACGAGWTQLRLAGLEPGACVAPDNTPLAGTYHDQGTGFRCAGEPIAEVPRSLSGRAGS